MIEDAQSDDALSSASRKIDFLARLELVIAILLTAVVLLFLAMRATHAGALWRDEAAALQLAQMPTISDIAANFQHEAFPLPFPLLIRGYTGLVGASDASLRWFGFAVGVALLATAWFNSRRLGDRGPSLFLALFGLNATFLLWGTSLRGYGLGYVFLLLTIGLSAQAIRAPTTRNAIFATLAAIGSVQFMINAIPLIAAVGASAILAFAIEKEFRRAAIVCMCCGICALSFVPYVHSYLSADWNIVLKYPADFFSLWEKLKLALQEQSVLGAILWYTALPVIIVAAVSRWWIVRRKKSSGEAALLLFLTAASAFSVIAYYAFLQILSYATRSWYYLPLLCAVAGAVDLTGGILSRAQWFRIARVLFAAVALLIPAVQTLERRAPAPDRYRHRGPRARTKSRTKRSNRPQSVVLRTIILSLLPRSHPVDHGTGDERASSSPIRFDEIEDDRSRPAQRCSFCDPTNIAIRSPGLDRRRRAASGPEHAAVGAGAKSLLRMGGLHVLLVDGNWIVPHPAHGRRSCDRTHAGRER